tara:strand:- start:524 stop:781 length:258 start_codon:yes stop_codon:yes gene_type:complete
MKKIAADINYRLLKKALPRDIWGRRYRDSWYDDDRGGNDEGYHYRDCPTCGCQTEHESTSTGNFCIPCDDKARERLIRKRRDKED